MAILKTNTAYVDPDEFQTIGEHSAMYGSLWTYDPDTGELTFDGYTWTLRGNSGRLGKSTIDNLFINRLRAVAVIWRDVLTPAQRALWATASKTAKAARPYMKEAMPNGWGFFAEVALMLVAWNQSAAAASTETNAPPILSVEFISAVAATGILTFRVGFTWGVYGPVLTYAFVHHVDPQHIDNRDWSRRTYGCGYKRFDNTSTTYQSFTVPQAYPFEPSQEVQALVRIHQSLHGVTNYRRSVIAT